MLKKIYVCLRDKDKDIYGGFSDFCKRARQCGIEVCEFDCDTVRGAIGSDVSCSKNASYEDLTFPDIQDSLIVTDCKTRKDTTLPIVGMGADYSGSAQYVICDFDVSVEYFGLIYDRLHGIPHKIAKTQRIVMREMEVEDLPAMYEMYATLADCPYIEQLYEYEKEKEFTENYIANMYRFFQYGLWLVFDRESGKLVGRVGIENREIDGSVRQELGYLIRKDCQGQGYAYEACLCAMEYARRELGIANLFACVHTSNTASSNLAVKLGFRLYAENVNGMNVYIADI